MGGIGISDIVPMLSAALSLIAAIISIFVGRHFAREQYGPIKDFRNLKIENGHGKGVRK